MRTNVFEGRFRLPEVKKNYEVLELKVTASQAAARNFGVRRTTCKLVP